MRGQTPGDTASAHPGLPAGSQPPPPRAPSLGGDASDAGLAAEDAQSTRALSPGGAEESGAAAHRTDPSRTGGGAEVMPEAVAAGARIGRYLVLERLGEGGMGVVMAAYDGALERQVALKIVRPKALDHDEAARAQARLLREARTLAALSHTNIVPIYDVGELPPAPGRPRGGVFVAMELVRGRTLERFIRRSPPWRDAVDVFAQAGRGLAAAHAAGIVHGDFKPSNVLIDDRGRVRVVDFGLARLQREAHWQPAFASESRLSRIDPLPDDGTLAEPGTVIGTPAYMAPEQHWEAPREPSDQFAFCVALHAALFGRHPYAEHELEPVRSIVARIRDREPANVASHTEVPRALTRLLVRGLDPDPARRFRSMDALLAALDRARRPPGRRALAVLAGGLGLVALVAVARGRGDPPREDACGEWPRVDRVWGESRRGQLEATVRSAKAKAPWIEDTARVVARDLDRYAAAWVRHRTSVCRDEARASTDAQRAALRHAVDCLDRRLAELDALADVLAGADAEAWSALQRPSADLTPPGRCRASAVFAQQRARDSDTAKVEEQLALGRARLAAGQLEAAATSHRLAVAAMGPGAPLSLQAQGKALLGDIAEARADFDAALPEHRAAAWGCSLERCDHIAIEAMISLVQIYGAELADADRALRWAERARRLLQRQGGIDGRLEASLHSAIGHAHLSRGELSEAETNLRLALRRLREDEGQELDVAVILGNLGNVLDAQGRVDEAFELLERSVMLRESALGPRHPDLATPLSNHALVVLERGDTERAEAMLERAIRIGEAAWGSAHPRLAYFLNNLGNVHLERGDHRAALTAYRRTKDILVRELGPTHPNVGLIIGNIGLVQRLMGQFEQALQTQLEARAVLEQSLPAGHPDRGRGEHNVGSVYLDMGRVAEAEQAYRRALEIREEALGPEHPLVGTTVDNLGRVALELGDIDEAERRHQRSGAIWRAAYGDDHPKVAVAQTGLAEARLRSCEAPECRRRLAVPESCLAACRGARLPLRDALRILTQDEVESDPADVARAQWALARALVRPPDADPQEGRRLAVAALAVYAEGPDSDTVVEIEAFLDELR